MKNKVTFFLLFISSVFFVAFDSYKTQSAGAPIASTGAPGENTCARSGCHSDYSINSGSGILSVNYNNGNFIYESGKKYSITVTMHQQSTNRFGFQAIALKNSDNTYVGTFGTIDNVRTQIMAGYNQYAGRNYMTYKYPGTEPFATDTGQWTFEWTAPVNNEGNITFYIASVAANNDGTDNGDLVYTTLLNLSPNATGFPEPQTAKEISIYPNPASNEFDVALSGGGGKFSLQLLDVSGKKVKDLYEGSLEKNATIFHVEIGNEISDGVYFLKLEDATGITNKKILIQH